MASRRRGKGRRKVGRKSAGCVVGSATARSESLPRISPRHAIAAPVTARLGLESSVVQNENMIAFSLPRRWFGRVTGLFLFPHRTGIFTMSDLSACALLAYDDCVDLS